MIASKTFVSDLSSIRAARQFAGAQLEDLAADDRDAAALMVSELVTNSIRHAQSWFRVTVDRSGDGVRVEVSDQGNGEPTLRDPSPSEPTGRGLRLVDAMSARWGVDRVGSETTVWFELDSQGAGGDGRRTSADRSGSASGGDVVDLAERSGSDRSGSARSQLARRVAA